MLVDKVREIVAGKLETLDGVVALAQERHDVAPHLFVPEDELSTLVLEPRYPVALTVREIIKCYPRAHIGVVARGCQERALVELANWKQLNLDQVEVIGFPCSAQQAIECRCSQPYPTDIAVGERAEGVKDEVLEEFKSTKSREERLAFWQGQFAKCTKCYGCREICPVCFCETCALEQETWVDRERFPCPSRTSTSLRPFTPPASASV